MTVTPIDDKAQDKAQEEALADLRASIERMKASAQDA